MSRSRLLSLASLAFVLVALWLAASAPPTAETSASAVGAPAPRPRSAEAPPDEQMSRRGAAEALPPEAPSDAAPTTERAALADELANDPTVAMALNREKIERMELATARFDMAIADGDFTADHLDPAVITAFDHVELEPQLDPDGKIVGLEITSIEPDSPFLAAGFANGDWITEIGDQVLSDPAELPAMLVALSSPFRLCAQRGAARLCRDVSVE